MKVAILDLAVDVDELNSTVDVTGVKTDVAVPSVEVELDYRFW